MKRIRFMLLSCRKKYVRMRYKRKELDAVELGDELLLCEETGQQVHRLNRTAAEIWKLCDGERAVSEIAAHLARNFRGASAKQMEGDVRAALQEMTRSGILCSCE